jgi:DNA-directed RNA polymerase subunit F
MIKERKPLNMCEVTEVLKEIKETDKTKELKSFIKDFCKVTPAKARELKEELIKLDVIKLKEGDIAKIIDIMPGDATELNKIFVDIALDADETNKILATIKKYE